MYKCHLPWKQVDHVRRNLSLCYVPSYLSRACISSSNCATVSYHVFTTWELLTHSLPLVIERSQVVVRPPLASETWFSRLKFFKVLKMKRDLSSGWTESVTCTFKGIKKRLGALGPPEHYYNRRNTRRRCRHGRNGFVVLFVR
jgi:hypothetical protein